MSGTAEKKTRRSLRRAVGDAAIQRIDAHEQGLRAHAMSLQRLEKLCDVQRQAREALKRDLEEGIATCRYLINHVECDYANRRTFWGRLRWLLVGR